MKAVVFDMDGVLFDTERLYMDGWEKVGRQRKLTAVGDVARQCIGLNANDTRAVVLQHYGQDFPYDEVCEEIREWVKKQIENNGLPMKPGVKKLLAYLAQTDLAVGLASSTRYASVINNLRGAGIIDYFSVIVGGDMVEHSKPCPDIYLLACRKLGVEPEDAYAIEDSPNGIRSAHAAGMKPLMVPDLIAPTPEIRELSHGVYENLTEVMYFLTDV